MNSINIAMPKDWIKGAIKRPGALTKKAKAAGMSITEFCSRLGPKADTRTKRQCSLAKTLRGFAKKRKRADARAA